MQSLNCELRAMLQMHLSPRYVLHLAQVSKSWRIIIECNSEYWTRVAAHQVFASELSTFHFTRFVHLVYIPEGYHAAMNRVISMINKEVEIFGTIGYEPSSEDNDETAAECKEMIEYWKPYIHASLEIKTRMQLMHHHGTQYNPYTLSVQESLCMPIKEVAKALVLKSVAATGDDRDEIGAKELRVWVREFAALPNVSDDTKSTMMHKLRKCFFGRFKEDGKFVRLDAFDVTDAVVVACHSND